VAPRVLAVLGNHDYYAWADGMAAALERNGYEVLRNRTTVAQVRGAPLAVVGVDDPVTRHDDLDASFAGAPAGVTRLVLCHLADRGPALARRGADIVLSGHTHGGQIYVKGITDRLMKRLGMNYRRGLYDIGSASRRCTLYVTPGVGFSGVTRRVGEARAPRSRCSPALRPGGRERRLARSDPSSWRSALHARCRSPPHAVISV